MDQRTFESFYESQYHAVLALARVLTGDRGRAEDMTHEAFIAAYEQWESLRSPEAWVRRVVANKSRSLLRRTYAERKAIDRLELTPSVGSDLPPDTEGFWATVRELPNRQAQTIALYYLEDRPVSEISDILGCAESTARKHLSRGRQKLASLLKVES